MAAIFTLQFGTFAFPNQTFEILGHELGLDTPAADIRRRDGGSVLNGYLRPKRFIIRGRVYGEDHGSVLNEINTLKRALHNGGEAANFRYEGDRYVPQVRLAGDGIAAMFEPGLYGNMYNVEAVMIAERPFSESDTQRSQTGTRTNNSALEQVVNNGNYATNPVFTFVGGTWPFSNDLRVENLGNSHWFAWAGPFLAGQTLVIDCDAGCVLLQVGLTMVDAISYFSGNLFFAIEDGGVNQLVINAATLGYTITNRDRWYI